MSNTLHTGLFRAHLITPTRMTTSTFLQGCNAIFIVGYLLVYLFTCLIGHIPTVIQTRQIANGYSTDLYTPTNNPITSRHGIYHHRLPISGSITTVSLSVHSSGTQNYTRPPSGCTQDGWRPRVARDGSRYTQSKHTILQHQDKRHRRPGEFDISTPINAILAWEIPRICIITVPDTYISCSSTFSWLGYQDGCGCRCRRHHLHSTHASQNPNLRTLLLSSPWCSTLYQQYT